MAFDNAASGPGSERIDEQQLEIAEIHSMSSLS
jgi:hypothetical protein